MAPKRLFSIGLLLLGSYILVACAKATLPPINTPMTFPTFSVSPDNTQILPTQSVIKVATAQNFPLHLLWTFQADRPIHIPPRAATRVVLATLYGPPSIIHIALDPNTGKEFWQYPVDDAKGIYVDASLIRENTLIVAEKMQVKAVNLATGQLMWKVGDRDMLWGIATSATSVFSISRKFITAIDIASGEILWRIESAAFMPSDIYYNDQTGHVVVLGRPTRYLIDPATGVVLSTIEDASGCSEHGQLYNSRIYCGSHVYEAETGITISDNNFNAFPVYVFTPLIEENTMYVSTKTGTVLAVDLDTMLSKWEYIPLHSGEGLRPEIISNVAVLGTVGYAVATDATLRAFDISSGQEIGWWQAPGVVDWWRGGKDGVSDAIPVTGVDSDGSRLYASFGFDTLYSFEP